MSPAVNFGGYIFWGALHAGWQAWRHQDFLHTASSAEPHLPEDPADLAATQPHRLRWQIRCGDTAELSLRMVSCKSAISLPSVLIFFHDFFSLLAWHEYICLLSVNVCLPRSPLNVKLFMGVFSLQLHLLSLLNSQLSGVLF